MAVSIPCICAVILLLFVKFRFKRQKKFRLKRKHNKHFQHPEGSFPMLHFDKYCEHNDVYETVSEIHSYLPGIKNDSVLYFTSDNLTGRSVLVSENRNNIAPSESDTTRVLKMQALTKDSTTNYSELKEELRQQYVNSSSVDFYTHLPKDLAQKNTATCTDLEYDDTGEMTSVDTVHSDEIQSLDVHVYENLNDVPVVYSTQRIVPVDTNNDIENKYEPLRISPVTEATYSDLQKHVPTSKMYSVILLSDSIQENL